MSSFLPPQRLWERKGPSWLFRVFWQMYTVTLGVFWLRIKVPTTHEMSSRRSIFPSRAERLPEERSLSMEEDQETMTCHFMSEPVCYAAGSQLLVSSRILAVVLPLPLSGFALQPFWLRLRQLSSVGRVLWEKMDMGGGVAEYHVHVDGVTECHVHVDDDTFLCCPTLGQSETTDCCG